MERLNQTAEEKEFERRPAALKERDREREQNPDWYRKNDMLGMMMYTDAFAGTLQGVKEKLDYVERCGVNYLHLMPLLESPKGRDDGGYAVADFLEGAGNLLPESPAGTQPGADAAPDL